MSESDEIMRILLVEDDPDDVYIIERALRSTPIATRLEHAGDGAEALRLLDAKLASGSLDVDLVLLDLNMPVMDGMEFLRRFVPDPRFQHIPVVVLTTSREREVLQQARALGANAALSKASAYEAMCDVAQTIVDIWTGSIWAPDRLAV